MHFPNSFPYSLSIHFEIHSSGIWCGTLYTLRLKVFYHTEPQGEVITGAGLLGAKISLLYRGHESSSDPPYLLIVQMISIVTSTTVEDHVGIQRLSNPFFTFTRLLCPMTASDADGLKCHGSVVIINA
uniref:AlNc14C276G10041 protein n=1 Tax=Albugo laibachii Nc14 TaxID=890382 RepID=F0WUN3_9STRA|nr:AlNc14C276G10041 [Albugo laibachii Nc14]|eukprot:CCA25114.1 AlNc14C276G10041 [Albugo laibachii Nc14]